jgi:hypothetical protein
MPEDFRENLWVGEWFFSASMSEKKDADLWVPKIGSC